MFYEIAGENDPATIKGEGKKNEPHLKITFNFIENWYFAKPPKKSKKKKVSLRREYIYKIISRKAARTKKD